MNIRYVGFKFPVLKFSRFIILLFLGLVVGCATNRDKIMHRKKVADSIDAIIDSVYRAGVFSGTVLVADREGVLYKKAFGLADRKQGRPLYTSTPFYLASVSKQFTAAAIMLLHQDGLLSFDEPVIKYLDDLPKEVYKDITISNLLHHTSGIPDYYNFANPAPGFTNEDVYRLLQAVDSLDFAPGDQYSYSNSGYVLLSILVERISEISFSKFVEERISGPLNMKNFTVKDELANEIIDPAVGYSKDGEVSDYRFLTTGGGGMYASVEDLYLWDLALYSDKILRQDDLKHYAWVSGTLNDETKTQYGFGWMLNPDKPLIVRHGGELEGFRTHILRDTGHQLTIIVLANSGYEKVAELCDTIYEKLSLSNS